MGSYLPSCTDGGGAGVVHGHWPSLGVLVPVIGRFITHLRTSLTLGSSDKGGEAFKKRKQAVLVINHNHASLPRHADDVFAVHACPLAAIASAISMPSLTAAMSKPKRDGMKADEVCL